MYSRKSGWSAKQQSEGTGAHIASGNHSVIAWTVLHWDWTYPMKWFQQRVYICQGQQHEFEITEYSKEGTAWGFLWPSLVWRCSVRRLVFLCLVMPSSPKISIWRVNWKFHALHWWFLCFAFLDTWERSRTPCAESDDFELASESNCMLWNDIFNSRYFSRAILTEIYDKTRVYWRTKAEIPPQQSRSRNNVTVYPSWTFSFSRLKSFFKKGCYAPSRTRQHPLQIR